MDTANKQINHQEILVKQKGTSANQRAFEKVNGILLRARFGLQSSLRQLDQFLKRCSILRRDVSDDFAVEAALGGFEAFHETAVSHAGSAAGGVDAHLPERTERALLGFAITVGILHTVVECVGGVTIKFRAL